MKIETSFDERFIYITKQEWGKSAYTDYNDDLWNIIRHNRWTRKKNKKNDNWYLYSSTLKKSLHRLVMEFWYGIIEVDKSKQKDYVIDHLNNDGFDCKVSNLAFAPRRLNTVKGNSFDVDSRERLQIFAIRIFRDFLHKNFHITIASNTKLQVVEDGKTRDDFSKIELLYPDEFETVLIDGQVIHLEYKRTGKIVLDKLHFKDKRIEDIIQIIATPAEAEATPPFIWRDGQVFAIRDRVNRYSANFDKNWTGDKIDTPENENL